MFIINFTDNTKFIAGENLYKSRWNDMPNKKIESIDYQLEDEGIHIAGYEQYNHLVAKAVIENKTFITHVILMGVKNGIVDSHIFDFKTEKWNMTQNKWKQEYNGGATTGWKPGKIN